MEAAVASILAVEDHPLFAQSVVRLLHDQGHYDVTTASTAEQALDILKQRNFDLVLIDVALPLRSGVWLVTAIRDLRPELPCLMLSGHSNRPYVRSAMEAGAQGYVLKDDVAGILEGIQEILSGGMFLSRPLRAP